MKTLLIATALFSVYTGVFAKGLNISYVTAPRNKPTNTPLYFHQIRNYSKVAGLMQKMRNGLGRTGPANRRSLEKLDSVVLVEESKHEYVYNNNGNTVQLTNYEWDSGSWLNTYKQVYTYDNSGEMALSCDFVLWVDSQWVNSQKTEFFHNNSGIIISQIVYTWQEDQWVNWGKYDYTLDTDGKLVLYNVYTWEPDQWVKYTQNTYTYNTGGIDIQVMISEWDSDHWLNLQKIEYTLNNSGNIVLSHWHDRVNDTLWENSEKAEYAYNSSGNTVLFTDYIWEEDQWVNSEKTEYTYDNNDNMILNIVYEWEGNQWVNAYKSEGAFDLSISVDDIIFPNALPRPDLLTWVNTWYGPGGKNKTDSSKFYIWNSATGVWNIDLNIKSYYSPFVVPIITDPQLTNKHTTSPLKIQTNRAGTLLSLTNRTGSDIGLSIYSLNGKRIKRVVVPEAGLVMDISSLAPGIYFGRYSQRNVLFTVKLFMKQ